MGTLGMLEYTIGDELDDAKLWWFSSDGSLVDFSVPHTYAASLFAVNDPTYTNAFGTVKTTGFTGQAGAGVEPTGTPNLTVSWSGGTLDFNAPTAAGMYTLQIVATRSSDSDQRTSFFDVLLSVRH